MISLPGDRVPDTFIATTAPTPLWSVVLAAGGARRFGRSKLAVKAGRDSLLGAVVSRAMAVTGRRCVVVVGSEAGRARAVLAGLPVRIVLNRRWRQGMSSSLSAGIAALPRSATAALVLLADQFAVTPDDLRRLVLAWRRCPSMPAAAFAAGQPGAPAILPRGLFAQVSGLRGDQGARRLLRAPAMPVTAVDMPSAAGDLDSPADLPAMRRALRRR